MNLKTKKKEQLIRERKSIVTFFELFRIFLKFSKSYQKINLNYLYN
jgi:hypothetical protein